eukprot:gene34374-40261_t
MHPPIEIKHIESDTDLDASFLVMQELRPHLSDRATYATQIVQQRRQGYRLLAAWHDGVIVPVSANLNTDTPRVDW